MRIIQIAPEIGPGSGVAGVAFHLEKHWNSQGVETERFTLRDAHGGWLPEPGAGIRGRLVLLLRVVWFSTVGTVAARRHLRAHPDAVSVCHNDVLAGDVYVNHGLVQAAMRARGGYAWRMVRNPLHLFTSARDAYRYRSGRVHRLVVNLAAAEDTLLRQLHPGLRTPTVIIGNGVDLDVFVTPTLEARHGLRHDLGLTDDDRAVVFVGHEFDRKGLHPLMAALATLPPYVHLVVVGGTPDMVAHERAGTSGMADRVHFVGRVADPLPYLQAADVFALPSAYEAFPLVVLEALACGLPVVATPTGGIPDLIEDGVNGYVVPADPAALAQALLALAAAPREMVAAAARATAERHTWARVGDRYLEVIRERLTHESPDGIDRVTGR